MKNKRVKIDVEKMRKEVWKCHNGKAAGCDRITVEMVKQGFEELKGALVRLYKDCFRKGVFPNSWKKGRYTNVTQRRG